MSLSRTTAPILIAGHAASEIQIGGRWSQGSTNSAVVKVVKTVSRLDAGGRAVSTSLLRSLALRLSTILLKWSGGKLWFLSY